MKIISNKEYNQAIEAMTNANKALTILQEKASQKDAQIQALTREVDGLKGHIEHLESQIFTLESTEADQISQFKISGNKMAEALNATNDYFEGSHKYTSEDIVEMKNKAIEEWEKLNK